MYGTTDGTGFFEALQSSAQNPLGPQVHRGFAKRTLAYTRWVQDKLCQEGCFPPEKVTDRWDEGGIGNLTKLYVTGHSLGGAAALAFAYWVKLAFKKTNPDLIVHVYVFSAPNVGNAAWAKEYNEMLGDTTFQHNYGPDVVPQFPPWLWKVGHEVSLEHKTTDGFLGLTGKPTSTAQSAEPWPENMSVDDMSVNFPWFDQYHLGLDRIFVPCAHSGSSPQHGRPRQIWICIWYLHLSLSFPCYVSEQVLSAPGARMCGRSMEQVLQYVGAA